MKTDYQYSARASLTNTLLLCASLAGMSVMGQTITNPSFEVDAFGGGVGYISQNTPITGWTGLPTARVGINSSAGPFADNGAIPNGAKTAFIQSGSGDSVLSTVINGLTAGQAYTVNFRFNARNGQTPVLKIGVDGKPIVNLSTTSVGGSAAYKYAAFDFTAAAATAALSLTNDLTSDNTALVDDFRINLSTNGWSYAAWNDDASSGVDGSKHYTHAYNFGGGSVPDAVINGVTFKGIIGANPTVNYQFKVTGLGNAFDSDDANNITGNGAAISKRFIYGGNPGTFTLMGLSPGTEYVATFYAVAWETGQRAQTFSSGTDRLTVNQDHFNDNNGIRISYRYKAPASGIITLFQSPTLPANSLHLNGFSNYEVTAPTTPVVGLQPRSQVVTPGATVNLKIVGGGALPLYYQWYNNGSPVLDQTNLSLTLTNVTVADAGPYFVTVSNSYGVATSSSAGLTFGMIANPGFEADTFNNYPGYVAGNSPITGWTASDTNKVGLNPISDTQSPFVNNGTIPEGQQAAFIQSVASLSTVIAGLTPGAPYTLNFRANARDINGTRPVVRVLIDGQMLAEAKLSPVGGNPWRHVSVPFTPANATATLILSNDFSDTALVDDFSVVPGTTHWSYAAWTSDATAGMDSTHGYSHAFNFGGNAQATDTLINGVRFIGVPGVNPAVSNSFSSAGMVNAFGAHANAVVTAGGGSAILARSFVYGVSADGSQTITLTNLIPGVEYLATIYGIGFDVTNYGRAATFTVGSDRLTVNEDSFGLGSGIRVSFRYVADASGGITLKYYPTDFSSGFHTYGFCNEELSSTQAPSFYRQPKSRVISAGSTVTFDTLVGGQTPLTLQWLKNGVPLENQTNVFLTLPAVTGADTADYRLVIANAVGTLTSAVAKLEVGLALTNPSFEAETYPYPGYIGNNAQITGWTASLPVQTGINPSTDGRSPFADNGVIPDGARVAFIQADGGTLSQVVSGMTPGATYYLKFYENYRSGYNDPNVSVTLGGTVVVPSHTVPGGGYALMVSGPFLATSSSATLAFTKSPGPLGGDSTLLLDNVAVLNLPPTPPQFLYQPNGAYLQAGQSHSLISIAQGTLPMSYRWQRNGVDVPGATDPTLAFNSLLLGDTGQYQLIASNQFGMSTSAVAVVNVGLPFGDLFNSGVGNDHVGISTGGVDMHYQLVSSIDSNYPGPQVIVMTSDVWPIQAGVYMTNTASSSWISPATNGVNCAVGDYVYRTSFVLDTTDPSTARLEGKWAMDNDGVDIRLNGVSMGISNKVGFSSLTSFVITNGFVPGSNSLDFVILNALTPGPTAMRVELYGVAMPLVGVAPSITSQPAVSTTVIELQNTSIPAVAVGSAPLSYQWYYEGFPLGGQNGRTLQLSRVSVDQAGGYYFVVTNQFGAATSSVAQLVVIVPPSFDVQPQSQSVARGASVTFTVEVNAMSTLPLTYQWYLNSNALAGATGPSLAIPSVGAANIGSYEVIVSNAAGKATSAVAVLTAPNSAPVATNYPMAMLLGTVGRIQAAQLLAYASDPDGDLLSVVSVSSTSTNGGAVQLIGGTNILYTPVAGYQGVDAFTYTVSDGNLTATAQVVVLITTGVLPTQPESLVMMKIPGGFLVRFAGTPGVGYSIQRTEVLNGGSPSDWIDLDYQIVPPYGIIEYQDLSLPPGQAFYRTYVPY